jgi:ABC-type uncharacterized transport system substrate-binding protein
MKRREVITLLGGAAAAWPTAARSQESVRRIGVLMGGAETDLESHPRMSALQLGLEKLGWKVGRNLRIDYRWTMADLDRTRTGAEELLRLSPDVLLADGGTRASALLRATRAVPIVFVFAGDPVALGLVQSFARPGGNSTGFTLNEPTIGPKLLQFLMEIAPRVRRIAVIFNPATSPFSQQMMHLIDEAAPTFGVQVITCPVQEPGDIEIALARLGTDPGYGLLVPPDNYTCATGCLRRMPSATLSPTAASSPMAWMPSIRSVGQQDISIASCEARNLPTCRCRRRLSTNW